MEDNSGVLFIFVFLSLYFIIVCIYFYISFSFLETVGTFLSKISALMFITKIWRKCSLVRFLSHLVTIDTGYTFILALFYLIFHSVVDLMDIYIIYSAIFFVCSGLFTDLPVIDLSLYLFCCIRCWKCVTSIDSSVWCQCTVRCVHFSVYLKVSYSFCAIQACCLCCLTKFTTVCTLFGFMYWFHIPF